MDDGQDNLGAVQDPVTGVVPPVDSAPLPAEPNPPADSPPIASDPLPTPPPDDPPPTTNPLPQPPVADPEPVDGQAPAPEPALPTQTDTPPSDVSQTPIAPPTGQSPIASPPSVDQKFSGNMANWKYLLAQALAKRQAKKQAKLNKILSLAQTEAVVTNEQIKNLLRCTELTAWRYLKLLQNQGKLRRLGNHNIPTYELVK